MSAILRLWGGILVVAAGTAIGLYKVQLLRHRTLILQDILEVLFLIRGGICSHRASLQLLCNQLLLQKDQFQVLEIKAVSGTPKEVLSQWLCRQSSCQKLLQKQALILLEQWIEQLGSGTVEQECRRLDFLEQMLRQSKQQAESAEQKNAKVYLMLGVFSGLAVVIITF